MQIYECLWDNCDFQFEELSDCLEHCAKDSKDSQGHVQSYYQANPDSDFHCRWKNCVRNNKKNLQPFPNLARLVRHVRDMHINKGNGRAVPPENRSKYVIFSMLKYMANISNYFVGILNLPINHSRFQDQHRQLLRLHVSNLLIMISFEQ